MTLTIFVIWASYIWKKVALYHFGQPQKRNFSIKKSIPGLKSTTGKVAFQSNFKF